MKKLWILCILALMLTGCGAQQTFETVSDVPEMPVSAQMRQILVDLPENANTAAMESTDTGKLYFCDGYSVTVNTVPSGDLKATLSEATGFSELPVICTEKNGVKRYESVWTAAGEEEEQVGRICVLDDGAYHYVLTAMASESESGELRETWNKLFSSFRLIGAEVDLNSGS